MTTTDKPKVEVRSTTGGNYRRAGGLWGVQWAELDESQFTAKQLAELRKDPHLDFRIDGKVMKGSSPDAPPTVAEVETELVTLRKQVTMLSEQNTKLDGEHKHLLRLGDTAKVEANELRARIATLETENATLKAKVAELEAAKAAPAAPAAPSATGDTEPAKPSADAAPTEVSPAPSGKAAKAK